MKKRMKKKRFHKRRMNPIQNLEVNQEKHHLMLPELPAQVQVEVPLLQMLFLLVSLLLILWLMIMSFGCLCWLCWECCFIHKKIWHCNCRTTCSTSRRFPTSPTSNKPPPFIIAWDRNFLFRECVSSIFRKQTMDAKSKQLIQDLEDGGQPFLKVLLVVSSFRSFLSFSPSLSSLSPSGFHYNVS